MPSTEIAVLSYHGWEIDPELLLADVRNLREQGWRDVTLAELHGILTGAVTKSGKIFHVTSDDSTESDSEFVRALRTAGCPATMFICLGRMNDGARNFYAGLLGAADIAIGDHTYGHERSFHYRHVVGFHSSREPLVSSPEQLGMTEGSPVCVYGPDLQRPAFRPSPEAVELCRNAARNSANEPATLQWTEDIARALVSSSLGFQRFGKLCVQGAYEQRRSWQERIESSLREGRQRLRDFLGAAPTAFAYPWWGSSDTAESSIRKLGYAMTFAGRGLMTSASPFGIVRLPVGNSTPRPLAVDRLAKEQPQIGLRARIRVAGRRMLYA